jgi:hypothetical protein
LEEGFERPPDFDLATFWASYCAAFERSRPSYPVQVRVAPQLIPLLPRYFGAYVESLFEARARLLTLGGAVEVLEPEALRMSIADYAHQITLLYSR